MTRLSAAAIAIVLVAAGLPHAAATQGKPQSASKPAATTKVPPAVIDGLMAPVALYPDQLLSQMLVATAAPARVKELHAWLKTKPSVTGSALQDAAREAGYEPGLVALTIFPQVVEFMAVNQDWTTRVGQAFSSDRAGVLDSVQRLRTDALASGKLKSTAQQNVTLKTVEAGYQVIVIEPTNPQVVYVPQYNTAAVYTQAPASTTVIIQDEDDDAAEAMAAGLIGFTAGIAIGAAINNDYYYGPYGFHGSPYMYNDAWDDWADDREDAREDWYDNRDDARDDLADHREDMADSRGDRAGNSQKQRTERTESRTERTQTSSQTARTTGQRTGQAAAQPAASASSAGAGSYEARGQNRDRSSTAAQRSGNASDAFSGYSSGRSERSASERGKSSRSSSRSGSSRSRK